MIENIDSEIRKLQITGIELVCILGRWCANICHLRALVPCPFYGPKGRSPTGAIEKALKAFKKVQGPVRVAKAKKVTPRKVAPKYVQSAVRGSKVCHAALHIDVDASADPRAATTMCGRRLLDVRVVGDKEFRQRGCRGCQEKMS